MAMPVADVDASRNIERILFAISEIESKIGHSVSELDQSLKDIRRIKKSKRDMEVTLLPAVDDAVILTASFATNPDINAIGNKIKVISQIAVYLENCRYDIECYHIRKEAHLKNISSLEAEKKQLQTEAARLLKSVVKV